MKMVKENEGNKLGYKIGFVLVTIIVAGLLFFLFRNIILEVLHYTKANDEEGLRAFMKDTGWLGLIAIPIIEALEMVVVFIPAEFIQIPAGLSFFFPIAVILCDLGVCLGASIIYFLVHVLKIDTDFIEKKQKKINNIATKKIGQNTQILMYFLFVTPIIPFGAICYYASNKKISYPRYIFTCATGVIPSIVTSILMGTSLKYFITRNLPLWAFVLIVFGLGAILFIGMFLICRKYLFNGNKINGTPYSLWSYLITTIFGFYTNSHSRCRYIEDDLFDRMGQIESPKVYLCNHLSSYDVYRIHKATDPDKAALIGNRYYSRMKGIRFIMMKLGFIPKTLFNPDLEAIKKTMKQVKNGISITMFPEGRLSIDGTSYPINAGTSQLLKKLGIPVIIFNIAGDYLAHSKYRTSKRRPIVEVSVRRIIEKEELDSLSVEELDQIITEALQHNEFEYAKKHIYKDKNKAENLDGVLYHCPHCGKEFLMHSHGNVLECECGFRLELDEHFAFNENEYNINNIHDYYEYQKDVERERINNLGEDDVIISQEVTVTKLNLMDKKKDVFGEGVCTITKKGFSFTGVVDNKEVSLAHSLESLQALAFSVNEEYECYFENELYYFYPKENRKSCTKVALIYDLLHEKN